MKHYYGPKLPDKCTIETLRDTLAKNLSDNITNYMETGFSFKESLRRTLAGSCAGRAVWDKVFS